MTEAPKALVAVSDPGALLREQDIARVLVPKLRALADQTRLTLMLLIAERPRTVKELQEATGLSQTLVSHHLAPLREQQLVSVRPQGRSNLYTLCCSALAEPVRLLTSLAALAPDGLAACEQPSADLPAPPGEQMHTDSRLARDGL